MIKKVGNYLVQYKKKGEVAIAYKAMLSDMAGQMIVNQKMEGVLERTGLFCEVPYEGIGYTGVIFKKTLSEKALEDYLKS